jgi:hypothetical protein
MSAVVFYNYNQEQYQLELSAMKPISLPFPLNLHPFWKSVLTTSLLATLIEGTRLRKLIIRFLNSPETNVRAINYLIWVDQV